VAAVAGGAERAVDDDLAGALPERDAGAGAVTGVDAGGAAVGAGAGAGGAGAVTGVGVPTGVGVEIGVAGTGIGGAVFTEAQPAAPNRIPIIASRRIRHSWAHANSDATRTACGSQTGFALDQPISGAQDCRTSFPRL
jgi:hypothetical protein